MTITVVFDPPLPSDSPATFNTKAFSALGDLNDWSAQANALAEEINTGSGLATVTHAATSKTTPVDADELPIVDSAASWGIKKLTWANLKATLLTWLQGTVFPAPGNIGATTPGTGKFSTATATTHMVLGTTDATAANLSITKNLTGTGGAGGTGYGVRVEGLSQTGSDLNCIGFSSATGTAVATTNLQHYRADQGTLTGAVATQIGFLVGGGLTGATTNFGFQGTIAAGAGRWNFYASGDARNYYAGKTAVGDSTDFAAFGAPALTGGGASVGVMAVYAGPAFFQSYNTTNAADKKIWRFGNNNSGDFVFETVNDAYGSSSTKMRIDSSGSLLVNTAAGLGYGAGAGGTVTQATSKSTGVTLNKPTGQITMNNAALGAGATAAFILTNSTISASNGDTVTVNINGFAVANYSVRAGQVGSGQCAILVKNESAGSLSDAVVIQFSVNKGSTS